MTDYDFPIVCYSAKRTPRQWGQKHGESFREGIVELTEIRTGLMCEKNPGLTREHIDRLAAKQWQATKEYNPNLVIELEGIAEGANVSKTDLVILNNYTDFRDIHVPDQGCSVVFVNHDQNPVAGQTWDMHSSAKRYVCCMEVPCEGYDLPAVLFSLVGCIGMMGFHPSGRMIGVNNINTDGAVAGAIWPAVIRGTLMQNSHDSMESHLATAPVTSGHSYLIASTEKGQFWEVMPGLAERVDELQVANDGYLFHTNHCLGEQAKLRESSISQNSTTQIRYDLLQKKIGAVRDFDGVYDLMNDHEGYPKSICSNFQANAQDPSVTCGGAVGDLKTGKVKMWRGDPVHDDNFVSHEFQLGAP